MTKFKPGDVVEVVVDSLEVDEFTGLPVFQVHLKVDESLCGELTNIDAPLQVETVDQFSG